MKFFRNAWPILVIVGTIAGAAWTAAWNIRNFITTQVTASETRLTAQIAASENRLADQIEGVDERLTLQIAELRQYFVDHLEDHANPR